MESTYQFGMVGLGTMGRNLVYNMADNGFTVAGYDRDQKQVDHFTEEAGDKKIKGFSNLQEFINSLALPRTILLLVPAGKIVDAVIDTLKPFLGKDDLIIDCGNSHFTDTNRRIELLDGKGIHFMGMGISGGETGAREGASIMPGGDEVTFKRVEKLLAAVSAKVNGDPCMAYMGRGSAGDYVKMVHNGIEYALMQLISETYHLLKNIGGLSNGELHEVFKSYNNSPLQSYLLEITAAIFTQKDEVTGNDLVDMILDRARQKGTGAWTSQDAMALELPIPSIDAAVAQREMTSLKEERVAAQPILQKNGIRIEVENPGLISLLQNSFHFCMITTYAQGMALLKKASATYNYGTDLAKVASIWRGGCIIRSNMLEDITKVFQKNENCNNLMTDKIFYPTLLDTQHQIRSIITTAVQAGIPVPAMMASLAYFDSYRSGWLPANLIQAQRDFFGAHTYERTDKPGIFHTEWNFKIK